jgi:hypothetical protein
MKSIFGLAVLTLSLVLLSFKPSNTNLRDRVAYSMRSGMDEIAFAMRSGNAGQLSRYLDNRVDISLPQKSDTYSKIQAEMIIRDFFSTHIVENFLVQHKGSNSGSEFCVGVLKTRNGDYRTTLFLKQKNAQSLLQEIRFQSAE